MVALALEGRPEYQQALLRVQNAEAELLLARNNRLWDLSTTVSMDVDGNADAFGAAFDQSFGLVPDDDLRVALRLDVPIGQLAAKQRHVNARANLARARTDLAELRQSIDIAVRNAVRDVDARRRQVALASRASELAARKLDAERQKLNLGLTTNFRMILFEDDLVRAQNGELEATIAYLNALASLDQTLGTTLQTWGLEVERVERFGEANGTSTEASRERPMTRRESPVHGEILEHMSDGVLSVDGDGRIMTFNPAAARLLGISADAALNRTLAELFLTRAGFDDFNQAIIDAVQGALASEPRTVEVRIDRRGSPVHAHNILFGHGMTMVRTAASSPCSRTSPNSKSCGRANGVWRKRWKRSTPNCKAPTGNSRRATRRWRRRCERFRSPGWWRRRS